MASEFVDTPQTLTSLLDSLKDLPNSPPSLYFDIEGVNLSREGTISLLQLFVKPHNKVYLIDVHVLGVDAFNVANSKGVSMKSVLESTTVIKVFFDIRNDSDALYSLFSIAVAGIEDLQLMELATRYFGKTYVNGLRKCIQHDCPMTKEEEDEWISTKEQGLKLFAPEHGGSYAVFNERPMSKTLQEYCVQDVLHLPTLYQKYASSMTPFLWVRVREASHARVAESQSPTYKAHGWGKTLSPWSGWPTSIDPRTVSQWANFHANPRPEPDIDEQ